MERLKQLRIEKGVYQRDIAEYLGIDRTTYVKYESGVSEPSVDALCRLADYFGVTLDYLCAHMSIKEEPTAEGDELDSQSVSLLRDLSPEEVRRVQDFVAGLKAARADGASRQG